SKGPSVTVTDSPTENSTWTAGEDDGALPLSAAGVLASMVGASMDITSSSVSGTGERELPTNPVTPGVWRTAPHDSSVSPSLTSLRTEFLISTTSSIGTSTWKM